MSCSAHVYKTDPIDVSLDVYLPSSAAGPLPVFLFFHGGGLLMGSRSHVAPHLKRSAEKHGMVFVSADYRLAPQASIVEIVSDIKSAVDWCRSPALEALVSSKLGARVSGKLVVGGASAGGYAALLSGLKIANISPPVDAIVALYPITNAEGPFFKTPQHPASYMKRIIPHSCMTAHIDPTAPAITSTAIPVDAEKETDHRFWLYTYMIQEANLSDLLFANAPPGTKKEDYIIHQNLYAEFPPTYMYHGVIDDKVGVEQARSVEKAMKEHGIQLTYHEIEGPELSAHGFDYEEKIELESMYEFIKLHI